MRIAALLAPGLALACATSAAPVAFDNAGQPPFIWKYCSFSTGYPAGASLNPALPAQQQTGGYAPNRMQLDRIAPSGNVTPGYILFESWHALTKLASVPGPPGYVTLSTVPESIPLGGTIDGSRTYTWPRLAHFRDAASSTPATLYVLTSGGNVGAQIEREDGMHYAWVRLTYTESAPLPNSRWQPVEWGYETTPNTPIRANTAACTQAGDYTADGVIDFADLNEVLSGFGSVYAFERLNAVLSNFGTACR